MFDYVVPVQPIIEDDLEDVFANCQWLSEVENEDE